MARDPITPDWKLHKTVWAASIPLEVASYCREKMEGLYIFYYQQYQISQQ